MPVGTAGAVKGTTPRQLAETGAGIILANTYHLLLRPGVETVERLGGLHKLMAWDRPILTDSGGYQVFSLSTLAKVDDDGVEFASHVDGAKIYLNAEIATELYLSEKTIKTHLRNIYNKLNLASKAELRLFAVKMGLTSEPEA